jgi:tRNA (cmo5U34)-methyltransferase
MDQQPVHYPKNPDKFEFDDEVAAIFPNMADRSIPLYRDMHAIHANILIREYRNHVKQGLGTYRVLDIGASHGDFYGAIIAEGERLDIDLSDLSYLGLDISEAMVGRGAAKYPEARFEVHNICSFSSSADFITPADEERYHAVSMHYVMQFIHPGSRLEVANKIRHLSQPESLLFYGQKEEIKYASMDTAPVARVAESLKDFYIQFRLANGYTMDEIAAKTAALKNSMWEASYAYDVQPLLRHAGYLEFYDTMRYGVFHSFIGIKGDHL